MMHMKPEATSGVQIKGKRESGRAERSEHPLSSPRTPELLLLRLKPGPE